MQFVYCNSSFAPAPDQLLSSLFAVRFFTSLVVPLLAQEADSMRNTNLQCFQVGDVLVLNYSLTQAWG